MPPIRTLYILSGLLGLEACATTQGPLSLEIPLRSSLTQQCETLAIPEETELPPLAQDSTAAAQLAERRWWMQRDVAHEGVEHRLCRSRDEAVALIARHNQEVSRETP